MNRTVLLILVLTSTVFSVGATEWPEVPVKRGLLSAATIARQGKLLPRYVPTVGSALSAELPAKPLVLFAENRDVTFRVNPGVHGRFNLVLGHMAGASFAPIEVSVNGKKVGVTQKVEGVVRPMVSIFKTPPLTSHGLQVDLRTVEPSKIGFIYLDWENTAFEPIPDMVWRSTIVSGHTDYTEPLPDERAGVVTIPEKPYRWQRGEAATGTKGTAVAMAYYYRTASWGGVEFRLPGESKAVISVNGEIASSSQTNKGTVYRVPGHKMLSGFNRVVVRQPPGEATPLQLELSPGSGRFLAEIPDHLNGSLNVENWPRVEISNGRVKAVVALPDRVKGYYRGVRFDPSGMITELSCNGHSYFGENGPEVRNPVANAHCAGVAEEFSLPVGYSEAEPGQPFMKVGVGLLEKPYIERYFFGVNYWPVRFFDWEWSVEKNGIEFVQKGALKDWGYEYRKKIVLPEGNNRLEIHYTLINTGKRRLVTDQYAHNFIQIDQQDVSPDYKLVFQAPVKPLRSLAGRGTLKKGTILTPGPKTLFAPLAGINSVEANTVRVELKDKAAIVVSGDFVPYRFVAFANSRTVCPESFIHIDLAPGETKRWKRYYELY